ncbi:MAG: decaprenyl-phosphate phosphoribosyltransferase [Acidimicrobiales bacterium]|nr:MAG: decaprenyl-phosphate phosphoribosyltransferase [Acidimicrobiales bacterium]
MSVPDRVGSPDAEAQRTEHRERRPFLLALLVASRPKQWLKNVLVFAAPAAAGVLHDSEEAMLTVAAFVSFCLASSGTYLLNDAADAERDRLHHSKRNRPVAAGDISEATARFAGALLLAAGCAVGLPLGRPGLSLVVAVYAGLTISYSTWIKHVPVFDMAAVAGGFLLRAVGGAVAADVPISSWFFIVASAGSLFMVAGKRTAELVELGDRAGEVRPALSAYSDSFLLYVRTLSSGTAVLAYCLWAFEQADTNPDGADLYELSAIPFVLAVLRYALLLDAGRGEAPEDLVLEDRPLLVMALVWAVVFAGAVYAG